MSKNIIMNNKEIHETIYLNFFKMLLRRKIIDDEMEYYEKFKGEDNFNFSSKQKKYGFNILEGKVNSISQNSQIHEYIIKNPDTKIFIIMQQPVKKSYKQLTEDYEDVEVFFFHEFMEDVVLKFYIPEHQLLLKEEKDKLLETFDKKNLGKINITDRMSRYYNGKVGDIFRIIRPNINSGYSVYYRIVIKGNIEHLFSL
jgi:DNA-directed RNA polymerase subunit H (RpoH/RPB5)